MRKPFRAMMIADRDGKATAAFHDLTLADLPNYDVLVEVAYSSLNYKDGLAVTGTARIARRLPMVCGIDLAGVVVESQSPSWNVGDKVLVNGWGLSETEWGGYSAYQRVKSEWLSKLPQSFSLWDAMAVGTAGYTSALCVLALEDWGSCQPGVGEVLVTGAAGGVGSFATSLLASKGYKVTAATGRPVHEYLNALGASSFVGREALSAKGSALQKERWAGAIDCVGSTTLANVLAQTVYGGAVAACGLAGGMDLETTVAPHILRGGALVGIDGVMAPLAKRERAWKMLEDHLDRGHPRKMSRTEPMSDLPALASEIVEGKIQGRVVIDINA